MRLTSPGRRRVSALLLAAFVASLPGPAWSYVFEPPYDGLRIRVERFETAGFPRVDLFFRVDSGDKQDFRYLHPANLRLTEEEVEVKDFELQLESPAISLSLVMDDSGSIDPDLRYLKIAATRFVEELHRLDEVAVVSFDRRARVLQERTTRKDLVKEGIGKMRAYGATALYDGAVLGLESIRQGRGQKKMLLLTDGNDQVYAGGRPLSLETEKGFIERARAEGVEVYTIALGQHANRAMLERVARRTGGQAWYAPHPTHLREVFDAIARSMTASYRLSYVSPNARREKQDRTITLDVHYQHHVGRGVGTYWLDREVPVKGLEIKRTRVVGKGPGKMRIYTQGFEGEFLLVEFDLLDGAGKIVKSGRTTLDGYGRMERPDPVLVGLRPGTYTLRVRIPGQPLEFTIPNLEVAAGETTSRRIAFSRLVFYRAGEPWYDLPHPYGETSELLKVKIQDSLEVKEADCDGTPEECSARDFAEESQRDLFEGRLSDLKHHREIAVWLPEGIYDIQVANLFKEGETMDSPAPELAPLVETLEADNFQVLGGVELRFDIPRDALAGEEDVLSPDYAAANPDPVNPFRNEAPTTRLELERAVAAQSDRYLSGEFGRDHQGRLPEERMYEYRSPEEVRARLEELSRRYEGAPPPDELPDVDAAYLSRHGLGPEARERRLEEIKSHYLGERHRSFPDKAGASPRYTGNAGDRFQGVEDLRSESSPEGQSGGFDRAGPPDRGDVQEILWDLREKVSYQKPPSAASTEALGGVDPRDPQGPGDLTDVARRIRERLAGEVSHLPNPPHNLDAARRGKKKNAKGD